MNAIIKELSLIGIVPVIKIDDAKDAVPLAKALIDGGLPCAEVTFRTAAAKDAIAAIVKAYPEMLVGAGTVITLEQAKLAVECGAKFIVAPGFNEEVVAWCVENNIPVTPGYVTPTEIMMAIRYGLKVVKFFPANVYGGLKAIKALAGPFGGMKFIPTGGVSQENMEEFLTSPFIHAVGGSWVCPKKEIVSGNFDVITALCRVTREKIKA